MEPWPWPAAAAAIETASPMKFVPPLGCRTVTGATALVLQTLVAASSKLVAVAKLVMLKNGAPALVAWRKAKAVEAAGVATASLEVTAGSAEESGLTQSVAEKVETGSHPMTTW